MTYDPLRDVLMLSIRFESFCVFFPTEGIFVIFDAILNFILHFLPFRNLVGIFKFFFTKLHIV